MKRLRSKGGFTLIELLIVIIIIGILAAIAIPMFLNQRDKAKVAAVKEGVHSIQVGVQTQATDTSGDLYPASAKVTKADMVAYVDNWPNNPYGTTEMKNELAPGMFWYKTSGDLQAAGATFAMIGQGKAKGTSWTVDDASQKDSTQVIFVGNATTPVITF